MSLFEAADDIFEDETVKTFILANIWFEGGLRTLRKWVI